LKSGKIWERFISQKWVTKILDFESISA